jgi:hypothetical protein
MNDQQLRKRFGCHGRRGSMFPRGTINAAALIALLESGTFDELPGLRVVVTTIGARDAFEDAQLDPPTYRPLRLMSAV